MKSGKIRVLIIDDSASIRQMLTSILSADPDIEIMGVANDPFMAAKKIREEVPDVITLDVEMPQMDGITFLRKLMAQHPIPVIMCSSLTESGSETLMQALEAGAVDVILTDLHYWEGPKGVMDLVAVCRNFGIGVAMHSGTEFGVELAAMIHTAASIPEMTFEGDAHYHYLTDDIIVGGKMEYRDGSIAVPTGPGLGVEIDQDKLRHYAAYFDEVGDYYGSWPRDSRRPDWIPMTSAL